MSRQDKLALFNDFYQLFSYQLSRIPYDELAVSSTGKAKSIAEDPYIKNGFQVYRSRVSDGYRYIDGECYWINFENKISPDDRALIAKLKSLTSSGDF